MLLVPIQGPPAGARTSLHAHHPAEGSRGQGYRPGDTASPAPPQARQHSCDRMAEGRVPPLPRGQGGTRDGGRRMGDSGRGTRDGGRGTAGAAPSSGAGGGGNPARGGPHPRSPCTSQHLLGRQGRHHAVGELLEQQVVENHEVVVPAAHGGPKALQGSGPSVRGCTSPVPPSPSTGPRC